jgi:sialic acid synthase SpsE
MKAPFLVGSREVGPGHGVYRIADAGARHGGDVQLGYKLIETAGAAGAHAVLFDSPRPHGGLSERDFKSLLGHAYYVGITAFGNAADAGAVAFLASLAVPAYALPVGAGARAIGAAAATGMPLFLVAAGAEDDEIENAVRLCTQAGNASTAVLRSGSGALIEPDGHVIITPHALASSPSR